MWVVQENEIVALFDGQQVVFFFQLILCPFAHAAAKPADDGTDSIC